LRWTSKVPAPLAPVAAGLAFGLAASPCTTPVLAVLLGWIASTGRPLLGVLMLTSFGIGQVLPLLLAGNLAASLPRLLALRPIGRWVPPISGVILLATGTLTLLARLT
jgi:cytochrome c-type biogenesis protein